MKYKHTTRKSHLKPTHTFAPVEPVFLLPLVEENIEVVLLFEETEVAGGRVRGKDSLKISFATQLVFALCQDTHIISRQHVQNCGTEILHTDPVISITRNMIYDRFL